MEDNEICEVIIPVTERFTVRWEKGIQLDAKVRKDKRLGFYKMVGEEKEILIKSPCTGKIIFLETPSEELTSQKVCVIERCKHDVVTHGLCTFCGAKPTEMTNQYVGFVDRNFAISDNKAQEIYSELESRILTEKKLFLVLDLDNTIIHAFLFQKGDNMLSLEEVQNYEDIYVLELPPEKYLVKLRPYLKEFLEGVRKNYMIYVYTKGTRQYAEAILKLIDPKEEMISKERLITRDEMEGNDFKSLRKLIYDGSLALILDDSPSVWGPIKNLIFTKPFYYFEDKDNKIIVRRKVDAFLFFIQHLLNSIHEIFYQLYVKNIKIPIHEIYHGYRQNLFVEEDISFYNFFQNEEEMKKSRESNILTKLGGKVSFEPSKETTLIFSRASKKLKTCPFENIPIVSLWYISYCEMFCTRLPVQYFDLRDKQNQIVVLEKAMKEIYLSKTNNADNDRPKPEKLEKPEESEANNDKLNAIKDTIEEILVKNFVPNDTIDKRIKEKIIIDIELKRKNKRKADEALEQNSTEAK
jgi:TFIIF-interacting CTD phosphatases, including NLI-interacting factor